MASGPIVNRNRLLFMDSLRGLLASSLLKRIDRELGRETTLKLLWSSIVGDQLAANTQLKHIRGGTLIIAAPDGSWLNSLNSMSHMILHAVNRLGLGQPYDDIQLTADPGLFPQHARPEKRAADASRNSMSRPFDAGMITDERMRSAFLKSAEKYLAHQEEPK
jgi:hypothetical protein